VSLEELSVGIEAVTNDNIVERASSWFQPDKLAMVLLGDLKGRKIAREVFAPLA
jgi:predicted Zn-dependent peptidase